MRDIIEFNGREYILNESTGYYRGRGANTSYLHRDVWEHHNGKIMKGFVVHHIDHDKTNNCIHNLELMTVIAHNTHHANESIWRGSKEQKKHLDSIRPLASEWHRTESGKEHAVKAAKKSWENKEYHVKSCEHCNENYTTPFPTRSKFCSDICRSRAKNARRKRLRQEN